MDNEHFIPTVGRIVHYVSYGTPNGEFAPDHRAAVITATRVDATEVSLCVMNPTGLFFNEHVQYSDLHDGGTWHWPER